MTISDLGCSISDLVLHQLKADIMAHHGLKARGSDIF